MFGEFVLFTQAQPEPEQNLHQWLLLYLLPVTQDFFTFVSVSDNWPKFCKHTGQFMVFYYKRGGNAI